MLKSVILALVISVLMVHALAQDTLPITDQTTFPNDGKIHCIEIVNYTFPFSELTNCYILSGKTGQAIVIDPADTLDPLGANGQSLKKILVDTTTGESKQVSSIELERFPVVKTNAYGEVTSVRDPQTQQEMYVYDQFRTTNTYGPRLLKYLKDNKLVLKYIVVTHGHLDHFAAITYLQERTGAQVIMHENDLRALNGRKLNAADGTRQTGYPKDSYRILGLRTKVDRTVKDGDLISLDGMVLQVIHTPGHSPGSICLRTRQKNETLLFSGDTLLHWAYLRDGMGNLIYDLNGRPLTANTGRTNFIDGTGDENALNNSIRDKLFTLPENTIVYPGHYESTTITDEKKYGPQRSKAAQDRQTTPDSKGQETQGVVL